MSGVSHQMVGYGPLTDVWGAHCGNQLVDGSDLTEGVAAACERVTRALGRVLREIGFLGLFGLDLLVTPDGRVVVLEINPRFQRVTSLLNAAERAAGLLPMPGVHVLAFVLDALPKAAPGAPAPGYSQVVGYAHEDGTVAMDLWPGTLGMGTAEMEEIADIVATVLAAVRPDKTHSAHGTIEQSKSKFHLDASVATSVEPRVRDLLARHPVYPEIDLSLFAAEGIGPQG
ncbi:ATP-grasp domain-containing protein [Sphaerisporangium sp. NPDC051017]|uniref:ATP-grasp domain-containing protein n=1 Tax=Sphaerisporangium sp. NPDC051017 TaxID=3154636 RepID=UPI003417A1C4